MTFKKSMLTIMGALAMSASMGLGSVVAQEAQNPPITDTSTIGVTVLCGPTNTGPSTVSLTSNGTTNFESLDPSDSAQLALRSTGTMAMRVVMDIDPCFTGNWHVDATITDFTSGADVIPGTKFQLPIGNGMSSTTASTLVGDVTVPNVAAPSVDVVTFAAGTPNTSSNAIAIATGPATGEMYMDFTGQLANLDATTPDGTYSATFTVTFGTGAP